MIGKREVKWEGMLDDGSGRSVVRSRKFGMCVGRGTRIMIHKGCHMTGKGDVIGTNKSVWLRTTAPHKRGCGCGEGEGEWEGTGRENIQGAICV